MSSTNPARLWAGGLRCEGLVAPCGIDAPRPLLSWQLTASPAPRVGRPTAFQVVVATSPDRLSPELANRWNTGVIESSTDHTIRYDGVPLRSLERCHWAVRVRDEAGQWTEWSASAQWTMGLLDPGGEWRADWIHASGPAVGFAAAAAARAPDPWLRHEVRLDVVPPRAVALVASIGYHEFHVNGRKVGDAVLTPNVYDTSQRAAYVMYEFERYLQPGVNVLGLWLGSGWSRFPHFQRPDRPPRPLVSAQFYFTDSSVPAVVTGTDWLVHHSPITLLGDWDFQNFGGESYDGRAENDGWARPGLVTTSWTNAVRCDLQLPLSSDLPEPNRRQQEILPRALTEPEPGVYRVDFGRNFAGFVEVPVSAAPGTCISLQFSERADADVTHRIQSEYIVGPSGTGVFRNRFNYSVGRWLTLRGLPAPPDAAGLKAWCVRNDYTSAAAFECSHARLNRIVDVTRWTFENLTLGGFVADCPHRERMGYGGDGHASVTTGLYHYRLEPFLQKWNRDWHDLQGHPPKWAHRADPSNIDPPPSNHPGEMPYTAPTYWGGGGPAWSGLCVHLPWQLYRFSGDRRVLEQSLPVITRWLDFLETKVSENLLQRWGGRWDFLGDWMAPGARQAHSPATLFFNNCYRIWSLATAAAIARVVGVEDLALRWEERAASARRAVAAAFHHPDSGAYCDDSQVSLAVALLAGLPSPAEQPAVEERLAHAIREASAGHIDAGITGGSLLFLFLLERNRHDLLHLMVTRSGYPGWDYMLEQGATTWWEAWEEPTGNLSQFHSSFLYVGLWPLAGILGITPVSSAPGFARIRIDPGPLDAPDLTWARGHYESVRGRIAVAWRIDHETYTLEVGIPPGAEAEIALPAASAQEITERDRPLRDVPEVSVLRIEANRTYVAVAGGNYRFCCPRPSHPSAPPTRPAA